MTRADTLADTLADAPADAPAVTALFVPATRTDRIDKAAASGADTVIVDFEDTVAVAERDSAREQLAAYLATRPDQRIALRINNAPDALVDDLAFVEAHRQQITTIMLPKIERINTIAQVAGLGRPIWGLIESPAGLMALAEIAAAPGIARLGLGGVDFAQEIGADPQHPGGQAVLDHVRIQLVLHSAANALMAPINSPHPDFKDVHGLQDIAARTRAMGFGGMLCIHPSQVEPVRAAFAPSAEQLVWARRVVAAARENSGAFQIDGEMIDTPVLARAQRLLRDAPDDN